jgi:hypothetical protein
MKSLRLYIAKEVAYDKASCANPKASKAEQKTSLGTSARISYGSRPIICRVAMSKTSR